MQVNKLTTTCVILRKVQNFSSSSSSSSSSGNSSSGGGGGSSSYTSLVSSLINRVNKIQTCRQIYYEHYTTLDSER